MAIIKLGALIVGLRGTIGGVTYSANGNGLYAKTWAKPTQPETPSQTQRRARYSTLAQNWASLSGAQRAAWNALTAAPPEVVTNSLGDVITLSGWQWFTKIVTRRKLVTATPSYLAPTTAAPAQPASWSWRATDNVASGNEFVTWTAGYFGATDCCVIFLAVQQSATLATKTSGMYLVYRLVNPGALAHYGSGQLLKFGEFAAGTSAYVRWYKQNADGLRCVENTGTTIVRND